MVAPTRTTTRLRHRAARVLALFVAAVVVTVLAPLAQGQSYERLCSVRGDRYIAVDAQGAPVDEKSSHAAHCPLCLPAAGAPPSAFVWSPTSDRPDATPHARAESAHIAALVGAPFPPRAPPPLS